VAKFVRDEFARGIYRRFGPCYIVVRTIEEVKVERRTCECGCGREVKDGRRFCRGHDVRLKAALKRAWREERDYAALEELRARGWLPTKDNRRFGVEIEFLIRERDLPRVKEELEARGLRAEYESYNHVTKTHWKITTDSSVQKAGWLGRELVSPILAGKSGKEKVRLACEALRAAGAIVNRTCGLHVHHNAKNLRSKQLRHLVAMAVRYQGAFNAMVAPSRRRNQYCEPLTEDVLRAVDRFGVGAAAEMLSRYMALNLHAYVAHGTVEFRQHQGTLNGEKVVAWIEVGQALIRAAARGDEFEGVALADLLEWSNERREWWRRRIEALGAAA